MTHHRPTPSPTVVAATNVRNSGIFAWIVDSLAPAPCPGPPFGGTEQMIADFKEKVLPGREVKWRSVDGGNVERTAR